MARIGYARVSTEEQTTEGQVDALMAAGCAQVYTENASGGDPNRPVLAKLIDSLEKGDILVVVKIDRLARSVVDLMKIIDHLQERGISFRSLSDPIDTTSPQGRFTLQILGSVAEFERALIRERTKAGLKVARKNGKRAGNPGLMNKDPEAIAKIVSARNRVRSQALRAKADDLLPVLTTLRPSASWEAVAAVLNRNGSQTPQGNRWEARSTSRAAQRLVKDGLADPAILNAGSRPRNGDNLILILSGLLKMNPGASLKQLADTLEAMKQPTPRGNSTWGKSSVKHLLDQARQRGLIDRDVEAA
jgi:DNA invertase Pin-like site-specific DNA recombinase